MATMTALGHNFPIIAIPENRYILAARQNRNQLSRAVKSAFHTAQQVIEDIRPVFWAVASGVRARVDKLAQMGKPALALAEKPGMQYGGNNLVIGMQRKMRRLWRAAELKSMGFVRS